jgi:predicted metal-binding membrane protein
MLAITVFVLLEKTMPGNILLYRLGTGLLLLLWGGYLLLSDAGII